MIANGVTRANRPVINTSGDAIGVLKHARIDSNGYEYVRYEFAFEVQGITGKPIDIMLYTGTVINDEPIKTIAKTRGKAKQKKIYNNFTTLCLALNFLTENDLLNLTDQKLQELDEQLKSINNEKVSFTVARNKDGQYIINPQSVKLI